MLFKNKVKFSLRKVKWRMKRASITFTNNWNSFYIACLSQISMSVPQGPTTAERTKCASIYVAPSHASVLRDIRREASSVWVSPCAVSRLLS